MIWPFRRSRYVATAKDLELLKATSVAHLATMPGTDVVVGTLFTDPLAPPEEDPDEFYVTTPEAAPERRTAVRCEPLGRAALVRLRTVLLAALDPTAHGRLWMAVNAVSRWSELEALLDRDFATGGDLSLVLTRPGPDTFALVWTDATGRTHRAQLKRAIDF